jgi:hypothetical protein
LTEVYEELEEDAKQLGLMVHTHTQTKKKKIVSALESRRKLEDLHIVNTIFDGVSNFKYLGNVSDNK